MKRAKNVDEYIAAAVKDEQPKLRKVRAATRLVLYMRPQDLEEHVNELAEYKSTKSAFQFPLDQAVPVSLIKKLVKGAVTKHEVGEQDSPTRERKRRLGRVAHRD